MLAEEKRPVSQKKLLSELASLRRRFESYDVAFLRSLQQEVLAWSFLRYTSPLCFLSLSALPTRTKRPYSPCRLSPRL